MQRPRAREILRALVEGIDPFTNEELPKGTVLERAEVVRAMLIAIDVIAQEASRASRRSQLPRNIGKSWTSAEADQLVKAFQAGVPVTELALLHGRTVRGIESRLEMLGLLTAEQRSTTDRFPTPRSPEASPPESPST